MRRGAGGVGGVGVSNREDSDLLVFHSVRREGARPTREVYSYDFLVKTLKKLGKAWGYPNFRRWASQGWRRGVALGRVGPAFGIAGLRLAMASFWPAMAGAWHGEASGGQGWPLGGRWDAARWPQAVHTDFARY